MASGSLAGGSQPKIQNLGRYRLIAQLARGGMGVVYLALVRGPGGFNKLFVVKELKAELADDPQFVAMFLEEARLAARLSHPNIVQTIEVGSEGKRHFLAMEYLEGQPLHRVLGRAKKNGDPVSLEYQLHILVQALEGLRYAHGLADFDGTRLGIVHRDVSPHNILVTYDGIVKVVDFGIAKALDTSQETRTGVLKGKIAFMAPELVHGKVADQRVDVFAAGVILWEALAGRRMWAHMSNDMAILNALSAGKIPDVREYRPQVPKDLALIADRATAADPSERYQNVAALQGDLETFLKRPGALNASARDVGQLVAEMFAGERTTIQGVIDGHLKVLRGVASAEYPQIELAMLPGSHSQPALAMTPSGISYVDGSRSSAPPSQSQPSIVTSTGTKSSPLVLAPPPAPSSRWKTGLALVGVGLFAGAFAMHARSSLAPDPAPPPTASAQAATPQAASAPQGATSPATDRVQLTVNATPPSARVAVDDGPLMSTPFVTLVPHDGATHHVRIEAPRYATKDVPFVATTDATLDVALDAQTARVVFAPAPKRAATSSRVDATAPATTPSVGDTGKSGKPKRAIDTSDPYGGNK